MLDLEHHHQQLKNWLGKSVQQGWLDHQAEEKFHLLETASADTLFHNITVRPLVVAFFGGTGTGKSSLLNRLAGTDIAITGATRPTSHEVTLYLHQDHQLSDSISDLPMQQTRINYHQLDERKQVAWLDMPDFDSVESANRELVEQWLPYVDYLVYVVSPERYHDDLGWQILQQRQHRHRWLFVINHWDQGKPEQYNDFKSRLDKAGFTDIDLLRTSCVNTTEDDEFPKLEKTINLAIQEHGLEQLQQKGVMARFNDLQLLADNYAQSVGSEDQWKTHSESLSELSATQSKGLISLLRDQALGLLQPIKAQEEDTPWFKSKQTSVRLPTSNEVIEYLSNQRSENYLQRVVHEQENLCLNQNLPDKPLSKQLQNLSKDTNNSLAENVISATQQAMAKPGTLIQRFFYKICSWLSFLLPLAISIWAGWFLFSHYRGGMEGSNEFLGMGFISNTLMLMGLVWFIPWIIKRKLQPSLVASFKRGVLQAIEQTGAEMESKLNQGLNMVREEHTKISTSLKKLQAEAQTPAKD